MGELLLVRHGQTTWSQTGQHTGSTDLPLTEEGEAQAARLATLLTGVTDVVTSPLRRARCTAELAFPDIAAPTVDDDLVEWDYGTYEGLTTPQIREDRPGWWLWTDGAPQGETPEQVQARCRRVLDRVRARLSDGDVALVGHGHTSSALAAAWLGLPASGGGLFTLDAGSVTVLGTHHGHPVLVRSNQMPVSS